MVGFFFFFFLFVVVVVVVVVFDVILQLHLQIDKMNYL